MITLRPPYLHRAFDATSQWLNTVFLNGNPNESISGRSYREQWKTAERLINALIFWEVEHCYWSYLNDLERAREVIKGR